MLHQDYTTQHRSLILSKIGLFVILISTVAAAATTEDSEAADDVVPLNELKKSYNGPISLAYLTATRILVSEKTCVSLLDLETGEEKLLIGERKVGGYRDGKANESRFSQINDIAVQGNFAYIADYGCVRMYDMTRELVGTLTGTCGEQEEHTTVATPTFDGHLKLAVTARDLYVLDFDKVWRVNKETGMVTLLSSALFLSEGHPTSIETDPYSNFLFIAVAGFGTVNVIAVDIASGIQNRFAAIQTFENKDMLPGEAVTANVASLDIAPNGTIFLIHPTGLSTIDRKTRLVRTYPLKSIGYHEIAVSSQYTVISQEYYSLMYHLHIHINTHEKDSKTSAVEQKQQSNTGKETSILEGKMLYITVIFPGVLLLLIIVASACVVKRISRTKKLEATDVETISARDKYMYVKQEDYWM